MDDIDFLYASDGTGEAVRANVTGTRTISATTLEVDSLNNWPTKFVATVGTLNEATGIVDSSSVTIFKGHSSGGDIIIDEFAPGYSDVGNSVGQVVVLKPNTFWADTLADTLAAVDDELNLLPDIGGWRAVTDTWTYASGATTNVGTITVPTDATTVYQPGMRIRFTQSTVKYAIITRVQSTTLTIYMGTDYTIANAAISAISVSGEKAPFGFPLDPAKWTVTTTDTSSRTTTATSYTNVGSISISVPIGVWFLSYSCSLGCTRNSTTFSEGWVTLSAANNTEDDSTMTGHIYVAGASATVAGRVPVYRRKSIAPTTTTSYYLNIKSQATDITTSLPNNQEAAVIKAVCAYL